MKILIACSSGGHLAQALALKPWWERHERLWVTGPTADARMKLARERVVECHYPTQRNVPNLLRNARLARRILHEWKPDVVFSTGAAVAVPFMWQAHAVGARTIFMETVDRIDKPSLTGRLVYPVVDEYLTQWDQLVERLPKAQNVGVVL
ncbi:UDP-N-acetylglucosamine--LPS N-acetylglucosamine transferase [Aeromicrobium sp. Root495]|uniref:UDP-N-acetylglucosamine--LPS N-acetylglucosamine transferase n=1 Tax=Aeromicrobium sp. Root495 TaxID=1736550 RepID=UPI0006FB6AD8|nr:UDP-N-acetylglucosamine--LPS N-acetylglucosamine transferase [Aeromicrobium sp. Root495]KQY60338.1 UDP-N-acetylglucosamine--LPS N-acetylglucosamine transferase [Aeromicrobium sp. Root495]